MQNNLVFVLSAVVKSSHEFSHHGTRPWLLTAAYNTTSTTNHKQPHKGGEKAGNAASCVSRSITILSPWRVFLPSRQPTSQSSGYDITFQGSTTGHGTNCTYSQGTFRDREQPNRPYDRIRVSHNLLACWYPCRQQYVG